MLFRSIAQCERFLRTLHGVDVIASYDTAGSAKLIADERRTDAAAIASSRAADVFGLATVRAAIQDFDSNTTRFLMVGRSPITDETVNKTSLVFTVANEPGALAKALQVFAMRGLDLTKLESRPVRDRKWEYLFYVDLAVARTDARCEQALADLGAFATMVRVLGSYPSVKAEERR